MQTVTNYPSLIKSLKEEITTLKTQLGQELNSSASSAFSRPESSPVPSEIARLKSARESLQEVVQTMRQRIQIFRDLGLAEGRKLGQLSPKGSLTLLVTRLQAKISDYSRKVALLKGGEEGFTARLESSRKAANEQFTLAQRRVGALERKNEAIRERMKTMESEKGRLQDSWQSAVLRIKGEQNLLEKVASLERGIEAKEQKITLLRLYITKSSEFERNRRPSPTKSANTQSSQHLTRTKDDIKYLQSQIAALQSRTRKPAGQQAFTDQLKAEKLTMEKEIQQTSREIREKDRELLDYELRVEQLKSDLEKAKGSRCVYSSPAHTNSPSPINRSLALSKPALDSEPQPCPQRSPGQAAKRCESLSALRKASKSPVKSVGLASRIVAMNRGQFEANRQQCRS